MNALSHAVVAKRREPRASLDDFPTPPWATRALSEIVIPAVTELPIDTMKEWSCWEPACNRGFMVRPLAEYFRSVRASDVFDYGCGFPVEDFLSSREHAIVDWVVTNPPFRLAEQFVHRALAVATRGVAIVARVAFLEGIRRYNSLFCREPPAAVAQFVERVPMLKGRLERDGVTATAYCWIVWLHARPRGGTRVIWIPPCRARLERAGDYP